MQTELHVIPANTFVAARRLTSSGHHHGWQVASRSAFGGARIHFDMQGGDRAKAVCQAICDRLNARTGKHSFANTKLVAPTDADLAAAQATLGR